MGTGSNIRNRGFASLAMAATLVCAGLNHAPAQAADVDFTKDIKPVLEKSCYECHSQEKKKIKGKFRVDDFALMVKGGESGKPGIVPGDPEKSLVYVSMTYTDKESGDHDALLMPPPKNGKPKKLPDETIAKFKEWIKAGAKQ